MKYRILITLILLIVLGVLYVVVNNQSAQQSQPSDQGLTIH